MWPMVAPWLAPGSITGVLGLLAYRLHNDAVRAERGRADDARARAVAAEARADLREQQIGILLGRVKDPAP